MVYKHQTSGKISSLNKSPTKHNTDKFRVLNVVSVTLPYLYFMFHVSVVNLYLHGPYVPFVFHCQMNSA